MKHARSQELRTGEWCRLAPDDIVALREIKALRLRAEEKA